MHILMFAALLAVGQPADTLHLADALRIAREANPMLRAARSQADAAAERVKPAGAFPEPTLELGLMNRMLARPGATEDPMTMNQVSVMQMLPWPGKLGRARRAASQLAAAERAGAEDKAWMLAAEVRMVYSEAAQTDRALATAERSLALLRELRVTVTGMYATGSGLQQDVLRAQVDIARMGEEITRMRQERVAAAARLNALLGRAATAPVGALELPEPGPGELPCPDTLLAWALLSRPSLQAQQARVAAAEASLAAARLETRPDVRVGIAYQARPAYDNMVSLTLGVSLPLFAAQRQLPMRREAAAMRDMSAAELISLRNETFARIVEVRSRLERDRNLVALYRASVLPQARAGVDAALASYRVGRLPFMSVLDNQMTVNRYESDTWRLLADYQQALGELEALLGRTLEMVP